jgi:transcriptional regulator with XRE-family HTH domain
MTIEEVMKFSTNLKAYLKNNNLTLSEFAEKLGVPISTAHGWVNGVPPKSIKTMKEISIILDTSVDDLCFGDRNHMHETDLVISIGNESFKLILKKLPKKEG